jgi:hypothetical protein
VATFRTWARVNLARCGSPCTIPIVIRITNFGTHRESDVPYAVATTGGPARTYSSACSGNAALRSRDNDVDQGETVVIRGCTVTYTATGSYSHQLTVNHTTGPTRFYDNNLNNNTATFITRVR